MKHNRVVWLCRPLRKHFELHISSYGCAVSQQAIVCSQVKLVEQGMGYLALGGLVTATLALLPFAFRLAQLLDMSKLGSVSMSEVAQMAVGPPDIHNYTFFLITTVQRVCLCGLFFFMMCVAERTYKQVSSYFLSLSINILATE